jgi:hypothetical protein
MEQHEPMEEQNEPVVPLDQFKAKMEKLRLAAEREEKYRTESEKEDLRQM